MRCLIAGCLLGLGCGSAPVAAGTAVPAPAARAASETAPSSPVAWQPTLSAASRRAAAEHKLVFLELTSPGCGACARLERETYPNASVRRELEAYVPAKVDLTVDEATASRFNADRSPDLLLLTPDGRVINRLSRFVSAPDLTEFLAAGAVAPERDLPPERAVPWASSFADAQKLAKQRGLPVFVYVWNYG